MFICYLEQNHNPNFLSIDHYFSILENNKYCHSSINSLLILQVNNKCRKIFSIVESQMEHKPSIQNNSIFQRCQHIRGSNCTTSNLRSCTGTFEIYIIKIRDVGMFLKYRIRFIC